MNKGNKKTEKLCGFYVSDWHLSTMLLPYINNQIDKNTKVITILENNIEENIKTLVKKLNLKNQQEILEISWKNVNSKKYSDIEKILSQEIKKSGENVILINGCKEYIEKNNENIEKWLKKTEVKNVKIINLFEITEFNYHIKDILDKHDKILNTSGEKEISEVFEGYIKEEKQEIVS